MHEANIVLSLHPSTLSKGAIRVEIDHLTAIILQRLLQQGSMSALPNEDLKTYLEDLGFDFPSPLQLSALVKQLREDMRLMGVNNPVLQVGGGLMINRHVKVVCEEDEGPDLLDVIYNGLLSHQQH